MMMMKSVIWWRKPEYPEETTDLRQVTEETFHTVTVTAGKQLRKHRLMAFNINPITSILYWCKAFSKRVILNGIIQL